MTADPNNPGVVEPLSALELAREYFPLESDPVLDAILWDWTGFPRYWRIPEDGNTPEECLRKELSELQRSLLWTMPKRAPS